MSLCQERALLDRDWLALAVTEILQPIDGDITLES